MSLAERLQNLLKEQRVTEADLGKQAGISQQAINKIVKGETKKPRHLVAIAAALQVDPIWLLTGVGPAQISARQTNSYQDDLPPISIYGAIAGSLSSDALYLDTSISTLLKRPLSLANRNGLYGFYMQTGSMEPRFMPGDLIIADAHQPPRMGDDCVLQKIHKENGKIEAYIKRFSHIEDDIIITSQYNPKTELKFPVQNMVLHRIIQMEDLFKAF